MPKFDQSATNGHALSRTEYVVGRSATLEIIHEGHLWVKVVYILLLQLPGGGEMSFDLTHRSFTRFWKQNENCYILSLTISSEHTELRRVHS